MIFIGNSRANGRELALHLLNAADNEHVLVHELNGFLADDLIGAFQEVEAISQGTKCKQYLFSLSLNPPETAVVSVEEFVRVIREVERRLGLTGQPRAIVFHEKCRRHAHCVWSRIDVATMKAINLPYYKRKLMDIARELYLEHGWDMPAGLVDPEDRDPLSFTHAQAGQAKRARRDPKELKKLFRACWEQSDTRSAFEAALVEHGFALARGDRRGFVAVDTSEEVYSLSRWCGVKTKELRARLGNENSLPDVAEASKALAGQSVTTAQTNETGAAALEIKSRIADLVVRQRRERQELQERQQARRISQVKAAQDGLPTRARAIWAKLTGAWQRQIDELEKRAKAADSHDRAETQALIERHLNERRTLDRELDFLRAKQALKTELDELCSVSKDKVYRTDPRQPLVLPPEVIPFTGAQLKRQPDLILDYISDKQAEFSRNDILRGLAKFIDEPMALRAASDQALASSKLVAVEKDGKTSFTTRDYQKAHEKLIARIGDMANSGGFGVSPAEIKRAISRANARLENKVGAHLSQEQIEAIIHILKPNQMSAVVGLAGTGKSTLLSVAHDAWEAQGYKVHGLALAGKAADSLQNASSIPSRTLASLEASWKSGYEPIDRGSIVVIDEAGMVGTRQLERIARQLGNRGCKMVLIGDPQQLQSIEAGTPFKDIVEQHEAAKLTDIRRQSTDWQRQASRDLANGHIQAALGAYADHGAVHEANDRDQAIAALVDDYIADLQNHGDNKTRLALAHRRKDIHTINQAIREALKQNGELQIEILFDTDHGPRAFAAGDRLLFTRNDPDLGVRNGMLATVEEVDDRKIAIRIDDENGEHRKLTVHPKSFPSIDHGYAVTVHRAQGCTVDRSFVLSSQTLNDNLTYVALTRHRENSTFYMSADATLNRESCLPDHRHKHHKTGPSCVHKM